MNVPEDSSRFVQRAKDEWLNLPPALQAASEGHSAGLRVFVANSVKIARAVQGELGDDVDPSARQSLLIVLCANSYKANIQPSPPEEVCQMLAVAAITIMDLEDKLAAARHELLDDAD